MCIIEEGEMKRTKNGWNPDENARYGGKKRRTLTIRGYLVDILNERAELFGITQKAVVDQLLEEAWPYISWWQHQKACTIFRQKIPQQLENPRVINCSKMNKENIQMYSAANGLMVWQAVEELIYLGALIKDQRRRRQNIRMFGRRRVLPKGYKPPER